MVFGDLNAHLQGRRFKKNADVRGRCLLELMHKHHLLAIKTLPICTGATSGFLSYGDLYESLIDHICILLPSERLETVLSCEILEDDVLKFQGIFPLYAVSLFRQLISVLMILIIIIIISLFQEDNIFGTNVSLTYDPRLQRYK